ncbi:MAG: TIGR03960 family B12-binding radical SAM protein [Candidatus Coatesbacteria bacterium]|nr:MAG: TIGR03960 family B12-binding radical SAM protein [Candidatus Coatesbacteria bacterium]
MAAPEHVQAFLPLVARPARYVGGEVGAREPDPDERLRVVLAFPDVYEVGMCNNGLLFLYEILNDVPGVTCERVFAPDDDMAAQLRVRNVPLYSLETGRPVREADVLGITVPSPLNYTSALTLLSLSEIPLRAADRRAGDALVIVGGHAVFNPEPVSAFTDACFIGEGDEAVVEITELLTERKESGATRQKKLEALAGIEGVYIPSLYEPDADGKFEAHEPAPPKVKKRIVTDVGKLPHTISKIIAWVAPVHDRAALEVTRGCAQACRFCQAGFATRPYRERPSPDVVRAAGEAVAATGTGDLSILGLNPADYQALPDMLERLRADHPGVRISLPAIRLEKYGARAAEAVSAEKPGQQTFAPEAGTERLRRTVNKNITDDEVLEGVRSAGAGGIQRVKLYFIVGLPNETDEDVVAIADLAARADRALRDGLGRWGRVTVNVAAFVPQAHTPLQWFGQIPLAEIKRRFGLLRKHLKPKVKLKVDGAETSVLEAALARGDRELGPVILDAYLRGARRDGWHEAFKWDVRRDAFARGGIDVEAYASRTLEVGAPLSWNHVDVGVTDKFLAAEYARAFASETTPDCFAEPCAGCGACAGEIKILRYEPEEKPAAPPPAPDRTKKITRLRFIYEKKGLWRFAGHLDLTRLVIMLLNRAGVPLTYGRGFSPKPRLELAPALPTCAAGAEEWGDAWLHAETTPDELLELVASGAKELGITFAAQVAAKAPSLAREINWGEYVCDFDPAAAVGGLNKDAITETIVRNVGEIPVPAEDEPYVLNAAYVPDSRELVFELVTSADGRALSPYAVAGELTGITEPLSKCIGITRVTCGRFNNHHVIPQR